MSEYPAHLKNRTPKGVTMIEGIPHRKRRGKLVAIPAQWFGKVTHDQTRRKRKRNKD